MVVLYRGDFHNIYFSVSIINFFGCVAVGGVPLIFCVYYPGFLANGNGKFKG